MQRSFHRNSKAKHFWLDNGEDVWRNSSPMFRFHSFRLVNDLLKDEMTKIHAFTQKTYTPDEWDKKQQKGTGTADNSNKTCSGLCGNAKQ